MSSGGPRIARRLLAYLVATAGLGSCAREPVAPVGAPGLLPRPVEEAAIAPLVPIATLLDSFTIGGVYTVLPRGGFTGRYARSPEKEQYAGTVSTHPTGIALPVGLPVRILAEGSYTARATAAFLSEYCTPSRANDPRCPVSAFTYSIHGLAPGPGVLQEYEPGTGLQVAWSRTAGFSERFWATHPSAEFFRGVVPASDTAASRELHFRRAGCCYYIPWGSAAWETYEGSWRFGAVPDDGGRAELGEAAVLRLLGPRTDSAMVAPAIFKIATFADLRGMLRVSSPE